MGKKKIEKVVYTGELVEETEYFKVLKNAEDECFYVFCKYNDIVYTCNRYSLAGPAILVDEAGSKRYTNYLNMQKLGNISFENAELESWAEKEIDGNKKIRMVYLHTDGRRFVRGVDAEGNLYKVPRKNRKAKEEDLTI